VKSPLLLAAGLALAIVPARAADYVAQVAVKPAHLYEKNGRQRVVLAVINNSAEVLDIVVACDFLDHGNAKIGSGHGSVSRLPPRHSDTVEVTDEIAQNAENARCYVVDAHK
jgi:hypothetical protein